MDRTYKYLGYFLLLLIPLTFAGFYKTYFEPFPNFGKNIDIYIHIHAVIASLWIAILIVQPFLIVNKKIALHRSVGKLSYVVFPLLIISFIPRIIKTINSGDIQFLFFPLADGFLLVTFYVLAIYYKKKTAKHMRYMIASALVLMGPTFGRIGRSCCDFRRSWGLSCSGCAWLTSPPRANGAIPPGTSRSSR